MCQAEEERDMSIATGRLDTTALGFGSLAKETRDVAINIGTGFKKLS